jgi:hypothetical protein
VYADPYTHMSQLDAELERTMRERELERVVKAARKQRADGLLGRIHGHVLDFLTARRRAVRQSGTSRA